MGRVSVQPERLTVSLTARALTIGVLRATALAERDGSGTPSAEREAFREVIAWDRAGRLYSVWRGGWTARRGLSGRVLEKWHEAGEVRRRWLEAADADSLVSSAAARAAAALGQCTEDAACRVLRLAAAFDAEAARADAGRFATIYTDIGVLPPDQYLAIVVQATEGCSLRTCEFCDLFDRPYRVKTPEEFRAHVAAVREYLGDSLRLRGRSAFVGAANALALPTTRLEAYFAAIHEAFDARTAIAGFVDGHTGAVKSAHDYRRLADGGLRRVYVGLESGHDPLLEFVRKPSRAADTIEAVHAMKAGGLSVGVIVMLGLGGQQFDAGHMADTAAALNGMPLGRGDLVYFSDLVAPPGSRYAQLAAASGIAPLGLPARREQKQRIVGRLRFAGPPPQIATYDIREFIY